VRRGSVFRRCTICKRRVTGRKCGNCGGERTTWVFVVDLEVPGAPRRQVMRAGFATRGEAEAEKAKLQGDKADGKFIEPSRLTVAAYLESWRKGLELEDLRPNTREEWDGYVRNHLSRLGQIRLQQLSMQHILDCYAELRQSGNQRTGRGLSPKSVWNVHLCLSRALKDAVKRRLLADNPARGAIRPPKDRPDIHFWTSVEFTRFLAWNVGRDDLQDVALYQLAVQTGMRRGELLGLRWSDIDWEARTVTSRQSLSVRRQGVPRFGPTKTRSSRRTIDLSGESAAALTVWGWFQDDQQRQWAELYQNSGLVFCHENGVAHDPRHIDRRFLKHVTGAGVKRIRFHDLRHSSAVIGLRELGEWPDEVSKRLGHESVGFTLDTYSHLLPQRGKEIAIEFDRLVEKRRAA
jgi:integrase